MQTKTITLQAAMQEEAEGLIHKLNLTKLQDLDEAFGFTHYSGTHKRLQVHLILQGRDGLHGCAQIGLEAAAVCASMIVSKLKPDLMINFGTCGGFESRGCQNGDVYLVKSPVMFHDRRISLEAFRESQLGSYPVADFSK